MSAKIVVPVTSIINDEGEIMYDYEDMADCFANELYQLDNTINVICTVQTSGGTYVLNKKQKGV